MVLRVLFNDAGRKSLELTESQAFLYCMSLIHNHSYVNAIKIGPKEYCVILLDFLE